MQYPRFFGEGSECPRGALFLETLDRPREILERRQRLCRENKRHEAYEAKQREEVRKLLGVQP